jgi:ribosomal protein S27E
MKKSIFAFKKDKYRKARGDYSRLLNVYCRKCENLILVYQKDGPGNLRRLYLDRICESTAKIKSVLKCAKCGEILGTPYLYPKEKRPAFRLYQDAVVKKIRKLK